LEEGKVSFFNPTQKFKVFLVEWRRSFVALRTTINGGGMSPLLQLHPKNFKSLLEEVRRGSFNPFD
jgi:hypothetical protein